MVIYRIWDEFGSYVGISGNVYERVEEHVRESRRSRSVGVKFYDALRSRLGDFSVEVLEQTDDVSRERYWIEKFDSFRNGYNSTMGGLGNRKIHKGDFSMAEVNAAVEAYKEKPNIRRASEISGIPMSWIKGVLDAWGLLK